MPWVSTLLKKKPIEKIEIFRHKSLANKPMQLI